MTNTAKRVGSPLENECATAPGEFEAKAREYIETCANENDRAYILALSIALDRASIRIDNLVGAALRLGESVTKLTQEAGR